MLLSTPTHPDIIGTNYTYLKTDIFCKLEPSSNITRKLPKQEQNHTS